MCGVEFGDVVCVGVYYEVYWELCDWGSEVEILVWVLWVRGLFGW